MKVDCSTCIYHEGSGECSMHPWKCVKFNLWSPNTGGKVYKLYNKGVFVGYEIHKDFNGKPGVFHKYLPKNPGETSLEVEINTFPEDKIEYDFKEAINNDNK